MSDVFNSIGEGVANVFGAGPRGGPLGGEKDILGPVTAAALNLIPVVGPYLSAADFAAQAGGQFSKGNTLGGALDLVGAGAAGAGALSGGGGAAGAGATGGASAPLAAAGGGATAPGDFSAAFQPGDLFSGGAGPGAAAIGTGAAGIDPVAAGFSTGSAGGADTGGIGATGGVAGAGAGTSTGTAAGGIGGDFIPSAGLTPLSTQLASASPAAGAGDFAAAPTITGGSNPTGAIGGVGGSAGAAAGPGGASAAPGFFDSIGNFAKDPSLAAAGGIAKSIPAGAYLGAAGLGYEALKGTPPIPNLSTLNNIAGQAEANSSTLINAELSGKLPPGAAAGVQQGLEAAQAQIRSQFASMGLSGSSAEADALANASQAASAQSFQIASTMAQQGLSIAGLPASIYEAITQQVLGQDTQFQNAIVNFATAAGGGSGIKLQVGGSNG